MKAIRAHIHDGKIVRDEPIELPEGLAVEVLVPENEEMTAQERVELEAEIEASAAEFERGVEAIEQLETTQGVGQPFPTSRRLKLKRLLLPKSRCHVYFDIDEMKQWIQTLRSGTAGANEDRSCKVERERTFGETAATSALTCG